MINCFNILNYFKSKFSFLKKDQLLKAFEQKLILTPHTIVNEKCDDHLEKVQDESISKVSHPYFRKKRAKRKKTSVVNI